MYHELPRNASFWAFLFKVDRGLAEEARQKKCPCGGCLHRANYPRKPRGGGEELPQEYGRRLSFCCEREGCRKRVTPPSVRFLGRKVYRHFRKVSVRYARWNLSRVDLVDPRSGTRAALRDALGVKNQRLGEVLQSLEQAGQIRRTPTGWRRAE